MDDVASGQRIIILAILVNLVAAVLRVSLGEVWALAVVVAAGIAAIVGLLRLATGLGYSSGTKVLLVVLAFVPLASLVMLAMLNQRATKALRAAGYEVGFFGATGKKAPLPR